MIGEGRAAEDIDEGADVSLETNTAESSGTGDGHSVPPSSVCVLLPTLDEEATIGSVVDDFRAEGFENVLVVDGDSSDRTREIARDRDARVIVQSGSGKGQAVREALERVEVPYVLMADADGTYDAAEADRMLAPLAEGYEHVIGNRFAAMEDGAMTRLNGFGNRVINAGFRFIHGPDFVDILSGYRAFTVASFRRLSLDADGFTIETELAVECTRKSVPTTVVPITYCTRPDDSETNLNPLSDGGRIIVALYALAKTSNPLFYFGSVGVASILAGAGVAAFVLARWLWFGVGHEILAMVSAAAVLLGVQLLMFGLLSDMIVTLHREQRERFEQTARELRNTGEGGEPGRFDAEIEPNRIHAYDATTPPEREAPSTEGASTEERERRS